VLRGAGLFRRNVLQKSSALVNVENLAAVADGKNRFVGGESVIEDGVVGAIAVGVESFGFWVARRFIAAIRVWVEDALQFPRLSSATTPVQ